MYGILRSSAKTLRLLLAHPAAKTKIAFASDRAGSMDIWVMNADGTNPVQLTNDPHNELEPAFSPDGRKIAFMQTSGRFIPGFEIYVLNANGTDQTQLSICCDDSPHDEAVDPPLRPFHTASD